MTSAGTPLRRSARPGWYGSGSPTRARTGPSVLASWTAPSASASHSRGLAPDEDWAGALRLTRTLAPGILSLARLYMSLSLSAGRDTTRCRSPRPRAPRVVLRRHAAGSGRFRRSADRLGDCPLGHGAELAGYARLLARQPGFVRPPDVVGPAELFGQPDHSRGDVDLAFEHAVTRAGRVGMVQVVPGLAERQD